MKQGISALIESANETTTSLAIVSSKDSLMAVTVQCELTVTDKESDKVPFQICKSGQGMSTSM